MSEPALSGVRPAFQEKSAQALLSTGIAAWLIFATTAFTGQVALPKTLLFVATVILSVGNYFSWWLSQKSIPCLGIGGRTVGIILTGTAMIAAMRSNEGALTLSPKTVLWLTISAAVVTEFISRVLQSDSCQSPPFGKVARVMALGLVATIGYQEFYYAGSIGAGDAHWYRVMLADFVTQLRVGVFPVWIGQSPYAFNGSTAPLRIAPLFQHEGGLVDLLTLHRLGPAAICNLTLVLNSLALAYATSACLRVIMPTRPWTRTGLTILAILSPAILAPVYSGDQYMTFVALPWLPLVLLGIWRLGTESGHCGTIEIALGLAIMWWAHAPIAMWASFAAAAAWIGHRGRHIREMDMWRGTLIGALVFLSIGAYPFLSAITLDNVLNATPLPVEVKQSIALAFPSNFFPVGYMEKGLARYQPGYSLLGLSLVAWGACLWKNRGRPNALLLLWLALPCLMLPVPGITDHLWDAMPSMIIRVNNAWPMQRLMPFWALTMVFLCAVALSSLPVRTMSRGYQRFIRTTVLSTLSFAMIGWTGREMLKFSNAAAGTRIGRDGEVESMLPQNALLTRYSYSAFSRFPYTYSHGFMDPLLQQRLLSRDETRVLVDNGSALAALPATQHGVFTAVNDNDSTFYNLSPRLRLDPGQRYGLTLDWLVPPERGYLQLIGKRIFREYTLPSSGIYNIYESRAFGNGPIASGTISLWTDATDGTEVYGIYIAPDRPIIPEFPLARFSLHEFNAEQLPIRVKNFMPYQADVFVPEPAWLETPKVWTGGYHATVNGLAAEVGRSDQDLVKVKLSPGPNTIKLTYSPPAIVVIAYTVALCSMLGWLTWALSRMLDRKPLLTSARPLLD